MDYHVVAYTNYELVGLPLPKLWDSFSILQVQSYSHVNISKFCQLWRVLQKNNVKVSPKQETTKMLFDIFDVVRKNSLCGTFPPR